MLREFLYVDVARVRSLLAQLDEGVLEHVVRRQGSSATNDLLALIGLKGIHQSNTSTVAEESRSVQDLLFTVFEEAVQSEGILRDLSHDDVSLADDWETSAVHERLDEGEIVRFSTRVLVVDPHFVQGRFERYVALNDALAEMALLQLEPNLELLRTTLQVHMEDELSRLSAAGVGGRDQQKTTRQQLERKMKAALKEAEATARREVLQPVGSDIKNVIDVVNRFLSSDAISVRFLACGEARPELAFSGSLLGRDEYIQRERDALFARYGSLLSGWTAVLQIASIPSETEANEARARDFSDISLTTEHNINRAAVEQAAIGLLGHMDSLGVSEGPLWPGISVTPLGIYRVVPRSDRSLVAE